MRNIFFFGLSSIVGICGLLLMSHLMFGIPMSDIHPHPSGNAVFIENNSCVVNYVDDPAMFAVLTEWCVREYAHHR